MAKRRGLLLSALFACIGAGVDATTRDDEGQAWVAEYALHDAQGDRRLVVACDADEVEYRVADAPIHVWLRGGDGLAHREVFPVEMRVVEYAPGDLRALGHTPDWAQLRGLVEPALRARLRDAGSAHAVGGEARRYRGDENGAKVELDWLAEAGLPAYFRSGRGESRVELRLRKLERKPAAQAFTATDGYRELDYTDIGDMELDPFARRYILMGAGGHR